MKFNWKVAMAAIAFAASGASVSMAQTNGRLSDQTVDYVSHRVLVEGDAAGCETTGCEDGGCESSCDSGCGPYKLVTLSGTKVDVGGWVSVGVTGASRNINRIAPVAFDNPTDEVLLNQAWLYIERKADNGGCGVDFGYRADIVYGADAPNTQAFGDGGWDYDWNYNADYGTAIPQLYGEVAVNDLTVKVGHFFTPIGYEVVPATGNFFYSHAYTMNYGEPFTHTGFIGEYKVSDSVKAYGGWSMGWDSGWENLLDASTFLGGIDWTVSDKLNLIYMTNWGLYGDGVGDVQMFAGPNTTNVAVTPNVGNIYMHSFVAKYNINSCWDYVFQSDYGINTNNPGLAAGNEWYGLNQYVFRSLNDCWKVGLRYEIFQDRTGARVIALPGAEKWQAATVGANWTPNQNLIVRPEVRWDWVSNNSQPWNGRNSVATFAVDAIFKF